MPQDSPTTHFFISYNQADRPWAEWIAWHLEEAGYTTIIQAWDFRPGLNFVQQMQQAIQEAERTITVLSTNYLEASIPIRSGKPHSSKTPGERRVS